MRERRRRCSASISDARNVKRISSDRFAFRWIQALHEHGALLPRCVTRQNHFRCIYEKPRACKHPTLLQDFGVCFWQQTAHAKAAAEVHAWSRTFASHFQQSRCVGTPCSHALSRRDRLQVQRAPLRAHLCGAPGHASIIIY